MLNDCKIIQALLLLLIIAPCVIKSILIKSFDHLSSKRNNNVTMASHKVDHSDTVRHRIMIVLLLFFSLRLHAADYLITVYTATWSECPDIPWS